MIPDRHRLQSSRREPTRNLEFGRIPFYYLWGWGPVTKGTRRGAGGPANLGTCQRQPNRSRGAGAPLHAILSERDFGRTVGSLHQHPHSVFCRGFKGARPCLFFTTRRTRTRRQLIGGHPHMSTRAPRRKSPIIDHTSSASATANTADDLVRKERRIRTPRAGARPCAYHLEDRR